MTNRNWATKVVSSDVTSGQTSWRLRPTKNESSEGTIGYQTDRTCFLGMRYSIYSCTFYMVRYTLSLHGISVYPKLNETQMVKLFCEMLRSSEIWAYPQLKAPFALHYSRLLGGKCHLTKWCTTVAGQIQYYTINFNFHNTADGRNPSTTWDVYKLDKKNGILKISTGPGFLPSTASHDQISTTYVLLLLFARHLRGDNPGCYKTAPLRDKEIHLRGYDLYIYELPIGWIMA